jgi:membrane protein DedA with SNARE-associated domain
VDASLLQYLTLLVQQYGYLVIFVMTFLECALFLGLFVPGETVVILGGIFAHQGQLNLFLVLLAVVVGGYLGDIVGYYMGYIWGKDVVEKIGRRFGYRKKHFQKVHDFFEQWGWIAIIIGRFLSLFRSLLPATIGTVKFEKKKFFLFDLIGTSLWGMTFVFLGYFLGESWQLVAHYGTIIVVSTFVLGFVFVYFIFKGKKEK